MSVLVRVQKFFALPWHDILRGLEAVAMLAIARFLIRFIPFSRWKHWLEIER